MSEQPVVGTIACERCGEAFRADPDAVRACDEHYGLVLCAPCEDLTALEHAHAAEAADNAAEDRVLARMAQFFGWTR